MLPLGSSLKLFFSNSRAARMKRSQQDVENLFASQGIPGRYSELAKHPAPSSTKAQDRSSAPPEAATAPSRESSSAAPATTSASDDVALRITAPQQEASTPLQRPRSARLGLVMPAPEHASQPVASRPLNELFSQLSQRAEKGAQSAASWCGTGTTHSDEDRQRDTLRHLRLPALFAHLERNGTRR